MEHLTIVYAYQTKKHTNKKTHKRFKLVCSRVSTPDMAYRDCA